MVKLKGNARICQRYPVEFFGHMGMLHLRTFQKIPSGGNVEK